MFLFSSLADYFFQGHTLLFDLRYCIDLHTFNCKIIFALRKHHEQICSNHQ